MREPPPEPPSPRLLLVEDDRELAEMLAGLLAEEGYEVTLALDGQRGLHLGLTREFDVLVIDRGLPAVDGLDLLTRLRRRGITTRVLILTALATLTDKVAGLDAGADDYLVKPFELDELLARIRALHRRHLEDAESLPLGAGALDLPRHEVVLPVGERITLSGKEFELLRTLAASPRNIHRREELRARIFSDTSADSIVDTYVYYLRRKLGRTVVRTVHGLGYQVGVL